MATDNCIWFITLLALHWRMIRHALTLQVCCKSAGLCRIRRLWGVNRSRVVPLRSGNSLGHESCFHITFKNTVYHGVSLFPLSSSRWSMLIIKHTIVFFICTTFTYIYILHVCTCFTSNGLLKYCHTNKTSMKIFTFAAKTIANCTHKSSTKILKTNGGCDQHLLDLDALLRALQRICLATMAAQGWVAYVACVDFWRLVMKKANQSKRKAWDATFYTTATCNRSWNVFHSSMSDFIGRSFHIEIFRRFRHAPNLQLREDSLAKKSLMPREMCWANLRSSHCKGRISTRVLPHKSPDYHLGCSIIKPSKSMESMTSFSVGWPGDRGDAPRPGTRPEKVIVGKAWVSGKLGAAPHFIPSAVCRLQPGTTHATKWRGEKNVSS